MTRYVGCPLHSQILTNTFVQSINVIDSPELRDLLTFISSELTDADIPHRSTLTKLIIRNFQAEYDKLCEEIQVRQFGFFFDVGLTYVGSSILQDVYPSRVMYGHVLIFLPSWPSRPTIS